jgi:hypothetical protein
MALIYKILWIPFSFGEILLMTRIMNCTLKTHLRIEQEIQQNNILLWGKEKRAVHYSSRGNEQIFAIRAFGQMKSNSCRSISEKDKNKIK